MLVIMNHETAFDIQSECQLKHNKFVGGGIKIAAEQIFTQRFELQ